MTYVVRRGGPTAFTGLPTPAPALSPRSSHSGVVTQLKRIGSGTAKQLYDDGLSFFCCDPQDQGAIDYIGKMAQRYGWAQQTDRVWTVTETGNALTPPPSLAVHQVLTRIFSLADPVKTEAKDWVPLIAIVIGATASATAIKGFGTLDVIRVLALAVLVVSVAIQLWGEYHIVIAFNQWRHPPSWAKRDKPIKDDYYSWWRLAVNALFDLAVIAAFGLLIFWQPIPRTRCGSSTRRIPTRTSCKILRLGRPRPLGPEAPLSLGVECADDRFDRSGDFRAVRGHAPLPAGKRSHQCRPGRPARSRFLYQSDELKRPPAWPLVAGSLEFLPVTFLDVREVVVRVVQANVEVDHLRG